MLVPATAEALDAQFTALPVVLPLALKEASVSRLDIWLGGAHEKSCASPCVSRDRFGDCSNCCRGNRGKLSVDARY
jgi:hypothetical protein